MSIRSRALLFQPRMGQLSHAGSKTQTRRPIKPNRKGADRVHLRKAHDQWIPLNGFGESHHDAAGNEQVIPCPYGVPGDLLYVKETFYAWGFWEYRYNPKKGRDAWHFVDMTIAAGKAYLFEAPDQLGLRDEPTPNWFRRPSLFMPREASRSWLEVISTRVEPLQDISDADARAEGVLYHQLYNEWGGVEAHPTTTLARPSWRWYETPVEAFQQLWVSINGQASWAANEGVWVVEFKRVLNMPKTENNDQEAVCA